MIEEDLLTAMVEFVMGFRETNNNMAPRMWRDFVYAGRVLERPEWVQEALKRLDTFMEEHFLYDGHWKETAPSYCSQVAGQLRMVTRVLSGYTPPESAPADLAAAFKKTLARTRAGIKALESAVASTRMPHGGFVTINDTWARPRKTRTDTKPLLLPGLGLAVLGGGEDHRQMYAWLNYTSGWEHKHYDALSLGLFAHGHELLRDIGYTHTRWRSWVSCTASHNTVVVDGVNSGHNRDHAKHRLRVFATDGKGFHLTEAESDTAYPDTAGRYRRTLVCVGENATDAYLIDVFQVHGGNQHDYLLHGTAAEDSTAKVDGVRLQPFTGSLMNPGATFESPQGERDVTEAGAEYGFVRNLTSGAATGGVRLDLRLSSDQKIGTRTHLVAQEGDTVYLGEAPRIRQAEHHDDLLKNYYAPFFCLRRRGENLSSTFVAVHEPVNGRAKVRGITTTELDGALLIAIQRGESGMDYFLMALDDTSVSVAARAGEAELRFEGRWGLARTRNGKASALHTIDANVLALNGTGIEGIPAYQGSVRAVDRGATAEGGSRGSFVVAETIAADAKFGALLIEFADTTVRGYNITRIEPLADGTRLHVAEDPALEVRDDTVLLTSYPQRTIAGGTVRYRLPVVGSLRCPSTPSRNSTYE
ncbi:MAG: heparinase II/III family protein [Lentisphaeria bacterium]|nr:heparinase II/III family protein [Lentisphaeria bacterium]